MLAVTVTMMMMMMMMMLNGSASVCRHWLSPSYLSALWSSVVSNLSNVVISTSPVNVKGHPAAGIIYRSNIYTKHSPYYLTIGSFD